MSNEEETGSPMTDFVNETFTEMTNIKHLFHFNMLFLRS